MGVEKYPLVLMLEPLFRCNLACAGCGKIDYPDPILNKRLSVEECIQAVEECAAPVVSIPGGEPLIHKEMGQIVDELIKRKKYIYLCTNALLLEKKLNLFKPSKYLTFSVHLDGLKEEHDLSVCQDGVFDKAVQAIKAAREKGFRVNINATLFDGVDTDRAAEFFNFVTDELDIEGITVSPGYAYERAPDQQHFLSRRKTKQLFRDIFKKDPNRRWAFSHSSMFLDFLAGNQEYLCTPWSNPTRNIFGWQRPCYLLNEGYVSTFKELMEETAWADYGTGRYEKCANCMAHCGYEGTAVTDMVTHPIKALKVAWNGMKTSGDMAPEIDLSQQRPADYVFDGLVQQVVSDAHNGDDKSSGVGGKEHAA
jgi:hopanoid biosynthesis associated radical SAM protein HpnH